MARLYLSGHFYFTIRTVSEWFSCLKGGGILHAFYYGFSLNHVRVRRPSCLGNNDFVKEVGRSQAFYSQGPCLNEFSSFVFDLPALDDCRSTSNRANSGSKLYIAGTNSCNNRHMTLFLGRKQNRNLRKNRTLPLAGSNVGPPVMCKVYVLNCPMKARIARGARPQVLSSWCCSFYFKR